MKGTSGRPRVIVHAAVSLDGRIDGFAPDLGAYYGLLETWREDVTLAGSETILAASPGEDPPGAAPLPDPAPDDSRPLLAVVDSRGRVRSWGRLMAAGHWRGGLALCSGATPLAHLEALRRQNVETLVAGDERVDLVAALAALAARGVAIVRIDAGPTLNGLALRAGVVDEVSLLVHPVIAGAGRPFADADGIELELIASERRADRLMWLRYAVHPPARAAQPSAISA